MNDVIRLILHKSLRGKRNALGRFLYRIFLEMTFSTQLSTKLAGIIKIELFTHRVLDAHLCKITTKRVLLKTSDSTLVE